ncbi:MAG: CoA-binding protein [bacterium]|nr:CoA-binding protein [bacterium]
MRNFLEIPNRIRDQVLNSKSLAVWPMSQDPMSYSYQIGRFFEDEGWYIFPINNFMGKILTFQCYSDIRLIPEDYDILLLFMNVDRLPIVVNEIFKADYQPPLVWGHEGVIDLESRDRLNEGGIPNVLDCDLRDFYTWARDRE